MRTRYLKPGFYENEELAALPAVTRLLYAGLWLIADKDGRLQDRPAKIKGDLFPYDATPVERHLKALADGGFILRYEVDGKRLIWISTFLAHQKPHPKEAASVLAAHPEEAEILRALGISKVDPEDAPKVNPGDDPFPVGKGKGKGTRDLDPLTLTREGNGEPETVPRPNGARPPSSVPSLDWDFTLSLYRTNIGEPDARARDELKGFHDRLDPLWVRAAINESHTADKPGFGYVKRTLERCERENAPPSSLAKSHR